MWLRCAVEQELDRLVRRLRHLPAREWPARREAVRTLLAELAAPRVAPDLPDHALADAVAVIGREAIALATAAREPEQRAAVSEAIAAALTATR